MRKMLLLTLTVLIVSLFTISTWVTADFTSCTDEGDSANCGGEPCCIEGSETCACEESGECSNWEGVTCKEILD